VESCDNEIKKGIVNRKEGCLQNKEVREAIKEDNKSVE